MCVFTIGLPSFFSRSEQFVRLQYGPLRVHLRTTAAMITLTPSGQSDFQCSRNNVHW